MATRRVTKSEPEQPRRQPATTPGARERQLSSLAYDLAEKQLIDGTASAQVVTHFLKAASSREVLEQERLAMEIELAEKKIEAMASAARVEELYEDAINAMRAYSGAQVAEPGID
jgi:hypothetical protein